MPDVTPIATLPRPRFTAAALVALVGATAIAVELLVPAPRGRAAKLNPIGGCRSPLSHPGCHAVPLAIEIDGRFERPIDGRFVQRPPPIDRQFVLPGR